jgi:Tfp pilus assembly protein PilF
MFRFHLDLVYARSGDTVRARQSLEAALKLQPDFEGAPLPPASRNALNGQGLHP